MTNKKAIEMLKDVCGDCRLFPKCAYKKSECFTAIDMAIKALELQPEHLVKESVGLVKDLVNDTISRQAAIDAAKEELDNGTFFDIPSKIEDLPPAQPKRTEERTETHACDYERAVEQLEHDTLYEPTFNQDDGSM